MKSTFQTICSRQQIEQNSKRMFFVRLSRCRLRAKRLLSCLFNLAAGRWKSPILRLSTFNLTLFVVLSELSPVFWFSFSFQSSASSVTSFSISSACLLPRWGFLQSQELARFKFEQDQDQALRFPPLTPTFSLQPQLGLHFSKRPDRLVSRFWLHGFRDFQAAVPWDCFTATGFLTFLVFKQPPPDCPLPTTFAFPSHTLPCRSSFPGKHPPLWDDVGWGCQCCRSECKCGVNKHEDKAAD